MSQNDDGDRRSTDQELGELTDELRVAIPGSTVLFRFLLTLPFTGTFATTSTADKVTYLLAFLTAGASLVLLLGETAYHRIRGHPYDKRLLVRTSTRQATGALVLLMICLTCVVMLVTDVVFGRVTSLFTASGVFVLAAVTWFVLPLHRRSNGR